MKKKFSSLVVSSIVLGMSLNSFKAHAVDAEFSKYTKYEGDPTVQIDYSERANACNKVVCTAEEQMSALVAAGKVMARTDLEQFLVKNKQKTVFIPLSLSNSELITMAAATSLGVVAFNYDQEIMDVVQNNKGKITRPIADMGNFLGSGKALTGLAAGSYFLGVLFKDNKLKQVGIFTVAASVATSMAAAAAKETFQRKRPIIGDGPYAFWQKGNKSFYSGHSTQAFTMATVIAEMYKEDYPIVPYVAYGIAAITSYARVHDRAHWASDVLIGAIAGHLITKLVLSNLNGNQEKRGGLLIYPSFDKKTGSYQLMFNYTPKDSEPPMKCSKVENPILRVDACFEEAFGLATQKKKL